MTLLKDEKVIDTVVANLSPLVNEHMDSEMRSAWLRDLAQAALSAAIPFILERAATKAAAGVVAAIKEAAI